MKPQNLKISFVISVFLILLAGTAGPIHAFISITNPASCPSTLTSGSIGTVYSYTFMATGAGGWPTWSVTSGSLPPGLILSSGGVLSGTPTSGGIYNFTVTIRKSNGETKSCSCTLQILADVCSFSGTDTGAISFGSIDPTSSAPVIGTVTTPVQFTCLAGISYTIAVNPASGWQLTSGSHTMGYTPGVASGGISAGTAVDVFTAGGSHITQGQYVNSPAGTYTNVSAVTITISYSGGSITASLPVGNVTGTVENICAVTGSPAINFGTLDAVTNAGGAAASVTPSAIMCTTGASITVTSDGGLNFSGTPRLKDSSTNYINYDISFTSALTGAGGTTDIGGSGAGHLALSSAIPANALDNAPAGMYTDTATLTISY